MVSLGFGVDVLNCPCIRSEQHFNRIRQNLMHVFTRTAISIVGELTGARFEVDKDELGHYIICCEGIGYTRSQYWDDDTAAQTEVKSSFNQGKSKPHNQLANGFRGEGLRKVTNRSGVQRGSPKV